MAPRATFLFGLQLRENHFMATLLLRGQRLSLQKYMLMDAHFFLKTEAYFSVILYLKTIN